MVIRYDEFRSWKTGGPAKEAADGVREILFFADANCPEWDDETLALKPSLAKPRPANPLRRGRLQVRTGRPGATTSCRNYSHTSPAAAGVSHTPPPFRVAAKTKTIQTSGTAIHTNITAA